MLKERKKRIMKVKINREGCISCGLCTEICPEVFRIAEDGLSEVYCQPLPEFEDLAKEAEESCPVSVIHTEE